ncbi:defensin beta 136 [Castor canadensis]|uniref:Beta-defensin 136 n=1 Tax=Castor canadensis TaxID=51338 RepID=A0A8B7W4Y2_CASCN|nr:beta-defensin 136 [Castor canadensis]
MSLCLSGLLFFLMILPSGKMVGNRGVVVRTCTQLDGLCFLGCRPGWTWIAFCHNILSCCKKMKKFIPPQANAV